MASLLKLIPQYIEECRAHRDKEQHHGTEGIEALRPVLEDMLFGTPDKNDELCSRNVSEGIQTHHPEIGVSTNITTNHRSGVWQPHIEHSTTRIQRHHSIFSQYDSTE